MDFIQQLQAWTKGDIIQGKWMIGIAIFIILPFCVLLIKSSTSLQKGMVIPLCLLLIMNVFYGGYLMYSKTKYAEQKGKQFEHNSQETITLEVAKIKADNSSYILTKYLWAALMTISVVLYFLYTKDYYKGLALGLAIMFLGMLLIDAFLHNRLEHYLKFLLKIT